jgi:hypothetical protein
MTEPEMIRRLSFKPALAAWALQLELVVDATPPRLTHKGRVWFRWLERQLRLLGSP